MGRTKRSHEETHHRLAELLEGTTEVFIQHGYRRTTMADVAARLDVSPGTLYLYFENKEALFHLLILRQLVEGWSEHVREIPVANPGPDATLRLLEREMSRVVATSPVGWPPAEEPEDGLREWEAVLRSLYGCFGRHHSVVALVERSAADWPELAEVLEGTLGRGLREGLSGYLSTRMRAGHLAPVPDVPAAAEMVLECLSLVARSPRAANARVRETGVEILVRAFAPNLAGEERDPCQT